MFGFNSKKCLTSDLFQLAVILSLLQDNAIYFPDDIQAEVSEIHNNNQQGNETILPDGIQGSTYYSHTSPYHQQRESNLTFRHLSAKDFDDPSSRSITNESNQWVLDDSDYYRDRIVEELRRLSIRRYSQLPREATKASSTFQNVTAYLLNSTNDLQSTAFTSTIPEVPTGSPTLETLSTQQSSFLSTSTIEDVENREEDLLQTAEDGIDSLLLQEMEDISLNYKEGFTIQDLFVQSVRPTDISLLQELHAQLNNENTTESHASYEIQTGEFESVKPAEQDTNSGLTNNTIPEALETIESDLLFEDVFQGAASLPLPWFPDTLEWEENQAEVFSDEFDTLLSDYTVQSNRQYDLDFSNEDLMYGISPYAIHGDVNQEGTGSLETVSPSSSNERTKIDRRRGVSSSGDSISSQDDLPNSGEGDQVDETSVRESLLDDFWETDSGIFESFLDSPGNLDADEKTHRESGESFLTDEPVDADLHDKKLHSEDSVDGEDSLSSDEMLQTAPIHPGVRPTPHPAQPRAFQVHARMSGQMRGGNVDQRFQELLFSLQPPHGDPNGPIPPPLPHHFGAHHLNHHHPFHHPAAIHHPHHHHFGNPVTPYTESARSALIQNATLPSAEMNLTGHYPNVDMGTQPPNLGSAVASSMHLTNNSEPMTDPTSHYSKIIENSHDLLYYSNSSSHPNSDMNNQTTEGILTSLMNDEALQLMDMMAMNEGMYAMRMLDNNLSSQNNSGGPLGGDANIGVGPSGYSLSGTGGASTEDRMEASSDSAVSSMGSERVPPMIDPILSDNEWSESEHHHATSYSADYSSKLRGYDYYGKDSSHRVVTPVPQKKHQMFGKRLLQEQPGIASHPFLGSHSLSPYASGGLHHPSNPSSLESSDMKYSCSLDFARHDSRIGGTLDLAASNHTYALPPTHPDNPIMSARTQRNTPKEKPRKEHMSRDEKKAKIHSLPLTTDEIVNLPMDEFNERLSKEDLTEAQLSLIRDIRRRGKNKVAAQNCRKRKIDQITQLENEVNLIRQRKQSLLREHDNLISRRNAMSSKYAHLYRLVFQGLRNVDGNPYNPEEWTLSQGLDGSISLNHNQSPSASASYSLGESSSSRRGNSNPSNSKYRENLKKDGTA